MDREVAQGGSCDLTHSFLRETRADRHGPSLQEPLGQAALCSADASKGHTAFQRTHGRFTRKKKPGSIYGQY